MYQIMINILANLLCQQSRLSGFKRLRVTRSIKLGDDSDASQSGVLNNISDVLLGVNCNLFMPSSLFTAIDIRHYPQLLLLCMIIIVYYCSIGLLSKIALFRDGVK